MKESEKIKETVKFLFWILVALVLTQALIKVGKADECQTTQGEMVDTNEMVINTDVPQHLKGATIVVILANGQHTSVPAEKFKVVPRRQQFIVTERTKLATQVCRNTSNNRVSVLGGRGVKDGLKTDTSSAPGKASVENDVGFVGGVQYQRMLNDTLSIGVQGQSNKTGSLLLGIDF